jgi:hypothetical protein
MGSHAVPAREEEAEMLCEALLSDAWRRYRGDASVSEGLG